ETGLAAAERTLERQTAARQLDEKLKSDRKKLNTEEKAAASAPADLETPTWRNEPVKALGADTEIAKLPSLPELDSRSDDSAQPAGNERAANVANVTPPASEAKVEAVTAPAKTEENAGAQSATAAVSEPPTGDQAAQTDSQPS